MAAIASPPPQTPTQDANNDFAARSVRSLIRLHPRERLFVTPLHWTPRHVDLLSCTFIHSTSSDASWRLSPPSSPLDDCNLSHDADIDGPSPNPSTRPQIESHIKTLAGGKPPVAKAVALGHVLLSNGPASYKRTTDQLIFRFQGHRIRMPTEATFSCSQPTLSSVTLPTLAYLDRDTIHRRRERSLEYICNPPSGRSSHSTWRLYKKRLEQITPPNSLQDPYILAMLIALAQSQRRQAPLTSATQSFQVYVVVTDAKEKSHLVVYTADVPVAFLDRLTTPHKRPRAACHLTVRSFDIPFEPYPSFPQRLAQAVRPPSPKCPDLLGKEIRDTERRKRAHIVDEDTRDSKRGKMAQR
ncbi:hypothetical protein LX36DRAFT_753436 [Colletotrichum falcatum]|nr:hypothetical protein LX36DRAFT_753436 [Colletotrichum falcatum]